MAELLVYKLLYKKLSSIQRLLRTTFATLRFKTANIIQYDIIKLIIICAAHRQKCHCAANEYPLL